MPRWLRRMLCWAGLHSCYYHMKVFPQSDGVTTWNEGWWVWSCCEHPIEPVKWREP